MLSKPNMRTQNLTGAVRTHGAVQFICSGVLPLNKVLMTSEPFSLHAFCICANTVENQEGGEVVDTKGC